MTMLETLQTLSSAEEFFEMLDVTYDPKVLRVSRLHILRRMGEYITAERMDGLPDELVAARCRATLERAYEDVRDSSPLDLRMFKVLKNAVNKPAAPEKPFVPFDDLV
jgi:hypothetical protein